MVAMYFVGAGSLMALAFAACMFVRVRREPGGNPEMLRISGAVQKGANAYLRRQYKGVGIFFAAVFVILLVMAFCGFLSFFTPFAFLTGGFFSGSVRIYRHAYSHHGQLPDCPGSVPEPEQGTEGGILGRLCYGVYRGGLGPSGFDCVVFHIEHGFWRAS